VIEAVDLEFAYPRSAATIAGFTGRFEAGELVAVTGPSGCGKSTLLYLLGLMLTPRAGSLWVNGERVDQESDSTRAHRRARQFGFVFQDAALDTTRSVLDNITETALYRGQSPRQLKSSAQRLMEQFGVELRAAAKPGEVSGGQAQRVALCRALISNPCILLADEPTGNLDPSSTAVVLDGLRCHASSGATVIVVTHDASVVRACDRSVML
jgi:ABC-type lipoprotein export system ATPase subunit